MRVTLLGIWLWSYTVFIKKMQKDGTLEYNYQSNNNNADHIINILLESGECAYSIVRSLKREK